MLENLQYPYVHTIFREVVKPVVIIGISVGASVVVVLVVLAISGNLFPSEEERALEEIYKDAREKNLAEMEIIKGMCYERYSGKALENCLQEVERAKQDAQRMLTP